MCFRRRCSSVLLETSKDLFQEDHGAVSERQHLEEPLLLNHFLNRRNGVLLFALLSKKKNHKKHSKKSRLVPFKEMVPFQENTEQSGSSFEEWF